MGGMLIKFHSEKSQVVLVKVEAMDERTWVLGEMSWGRTGSYSHPGIMVPEKRGVCSLPYLPSLLVWAVSLFCWDCLHHTHQDLPLTTSPTRHLSTCSLFMLSHPVNECSFLVEATTSFRGCVYDVQVGCGKGVCFTFISVCLEVSTSGLYLVVWFNISCNLGNKNLVLC